MLPFEGEKLRHNKTNCEKLSPRPFIHPSLSLNVFGSPNIFHTSLISLTYFATNYKYKYTNILFLSKVSKKILCANREVFCSILADSHDVNCPLK